MEDIKEEILEDAIQLCVEIVKSNSASPFGEGDVILISIEETRYDVIDIGETKQFLYDEFETPFYLEEKGLVRFVDPPVILRDPHQTRRPRGLFYIQIDTEKMEKWIKGKLEERIITEENKIKSHFNPYTTEIGLVGKSIKIPPNTNQFYLCKTIFKNGVSKKKKWTWDEILEDWGERDIKTEKSYWRKVYSAAREVNQKVAVETSLKDFFLTSTLTVQLNPKFI